MSQLVANGKKSSVIRLQKKFAKGSKVFASRKQKDCNMLSPAEHRATIQCIAYASAKRGKSWVTVTYEVDKGKNWEMMDMIPFIPEDCPNVSAAAVTVRWRDTPATPEPAAAAMPPPPPPPTAAAAACVTPPVTEVEAPVQATPQSDKTPSPELPQGTNNTAQDVVDLAASEFSLRGSNSVPIGFKEMSAAALVEAEVPTHILSRWEQYGKNASVATLFEQHNRASLNLKGVEVTSLFAAVGKAAYADVSAKALANHMKNLGIKGRTSHSRKKGLMFFFFMCQRPEHIKWPAFSQKRKRALPFSVSEKGRLVALMAAPENMDEVTPIMTKWTRAQLDKKDFRIEKLWDVLATIFNDSTYVPPLNKKFADYIDSLGGEYVYDVSLVPEHRPGNSLRKTANKLRANYQTFHGMYERSGHNQSDPTGYTSDVNVLMMFWTFHGNPMDAWACRKIEDGVDDDGKGGGRDSGTRHSGNKRGKVGDVNKIKQDNEDRIFLAALYESMLDKNVSGLPQELRTKHEDRMTLVGELLDADLDRIKNARA